MYIIYTVLGHTYKYVCKYLPLVDTNSKLDIYKILKFVELVQPVELHGTENVT